MKRVLLVSAFVGLVAAAVVAQLCLSRRHPVVTGPSVAESAFSAFGAFRSIAAEIVWFRADRLQEEGRYVELAQLAHTLALSEPHTPEVWSYAAWNLSYNVSVMMPSAEDRWRWVSAAIKLLRDDGLKYNPRSAELHRELAWLFELKIGLDIDSMAATYRAKWRELVKDVERRGAWEELGMDPSLMARIEMAFNLADRADPFYSAIYWAYRGTTIPDRRQQPFLREILRQAITLYFRNHPGEAPRG